VYEVIFDSRPATLVVMNDIVSDAEGRKLPGSDPVPINQGPPALGSAAYMPAAAPSGTSVVGADGATYRLPPYATTPLASDGSGLLAAGTIVEYSHPLTLDTSGGFCVAAEVVANGAWSNVNGGLMRYEDGNSFSFLAPAFFASDYAFLNASIPGGWANGSAHTIKACVAYPGNIVMYADGSSIGSAATTGAASDLSHPGMTLKIGGAGANVLSGARIRRVFACRGSDPALCN
jgi:hypothetical protein